jgi:peptidoglycan/LPS O-acetylase OafA/YrhL
MAEIGFKHGNGDGSPTLARPTEARRLSTTELVGLIAGRAALLAEKQVELVKAEIRANVRAEVRMAVGLSIAAVCGIVALTVLVVAAAFAIADAGWLPGWLAALLLAVVVLLIGAVAGLIGWGKRVRDPLATSRATLKENLQWAKARLGGGGS